MSAGVSVQRCSVCEAERIRDGATKTLYLYRRGRAQTPNKKPLGEDWTGFRAGVVPKCPGPKEAGR